MMVKPGVKELVEDNSNLKEVIEYKEDRGFRGALRLKNILKEKKFDMAVMVNPKKELHLAAFLAGIPIRIGFDRKWGFLLTHKIKDVKYLAEKHEVEYNLDLVRALGIEPSNKKPVLAVKELRGTVPYDWKESRRDVDSPSLIAIHPYTSNSKKQWPKKYFIELTDLLNGAGYNVVIIGGPGEAGSCEGFASTIKNKSIDLTGKLTLKELAALLTKCKFLVSSDSGPVHIAAAAGTHVVAIFGTADPGSNPRRWGPYGEGHIVIQKDRLEDILPKEVFDKIKNAYINS